MKTKTRKLVMGALFAAVCFVLTAFVKLPVIIGYINLGDLAVMLGGICLGPLWGALSGGLGSALADIMAGYPAYVPGTFIIKFLVGLILGYAVRRAKNKMAGVALGSTIGEAVMVAGYFVYEAVVLGIGMAAGAAVLFNVIQGAVCALLTFLAYTVIKKHKLF